MLAILCAAAVAIGENATTRLDRVGAELLRHRDAYLASASIDSCLFNRACPDNTGFGERFTAFAPDAAYGNVSITRSAMVVKQPASEPVDTPGVCTMQAAMLPRWIYTVDTYPSDVLWLYGALSSGITVWYPGMDWSLVDTCPGTYSGNERPWYFAGRSGQFDVTFMVDRTMNTTEVNLAKTFVKDMIGSLSFRHYANIVVYDSSAESAFAEMQQADLDRVLSGESRGVSALLDAADRMIIPNSAKRGANTDLKGAIAEAMRIYTSSVADVATSGCGHYIVLLTRGAVSNALRDLREYNYGTTRVLAFLMGSGARPTKAISTVTCASEGFLSLNASNALDMQRRVFAYLAAGIVDGRVAIRAAEMYQDYFTNLSITTVTVPIGQNNMLAIDVRMGNLSTGNVTSQDGINAINAELLSKQECEPREYYKEDALVAQDGVDYCASSTIESEDESDLEKDRDTMIACSVIFGYGFIFAMMLVSAARDRECALISFVVSLFTLAIVLGLVFDPDGLWDTIIKQDHYVERQQVTDHQEIVAYRCCEVHNCQCRDYSGPSCGSLLGTMTRNATIYGNEELCNNGYHCCRENCWDCNCYTYCSRRERRYRSSSRTRTCHTYCSTCCECVHWVNNRQCEVLCGTCHRVTIYLHFEDGSGNRHERTEQKTCSMTRSANGNQGCIDSFSADYMPRGRTTTIYVSKSNPDDTAYSTDHDKDDYNAVIVFGVFTLVLWIVGMVDACRPWEQDTYNPHAPERAYGGHRSAAI